MYSVNGLVIPVDRNQSPYIKQVLRGPGGLKDLQNVVGGQIEGVTLDNRSVLYLNGEGKFHDLPYNPLASILYRSSYNTTDYIAGDAIVLGPTGPERVLNKHFCRVYCRNR